MADSAVTGVSGRIIETDIPSRLDRLPWSRFHTLVVIALGVTWALDGLEVTLAGTLAGALRQSPALQLSNTEVGLAASAYLAGAVLGGLGFGWLTDILGRRKLFFITLSVYIVATGATAFSWDFWSFAIFRFFTGAGIGGEYTAINSTIQELIPARVRGRTDLAINGCFWLGALFGAGGATVLLDPALFEPDHGWRLAFLIGSVLGLFILLMRYWIPESPRWLVLHGRVEEARRIVERIERSVADRGHRFDAAPVPTLKLRARERLQVREVVHVLFDLHRWRAIVGLVLMAAQAFFYNAIFFTYALVLGEFYGVPVDDVALYIIPFAVGNLLGPLILGPFFDSVGRRAMIALTYAVSGALLALSAWLFWAGWLDATTQTIAWSGIFFVASAAASSAYLTVSETFPLELRAVAIAVFYAIGTGVGGVAGPTIFGALIDTGSRSSLAAGYIAGAALMLGAALVQWRWGVAAERRSLESVCRPLAAVD
ncbi:MAG: MFS transporter [Alphaproteobacteria bacterium]|nr:MFS transporter [Alphaproteobacteria bacterium]MCW5742358.1 MFS transporter [Alphaproteobacteria bacterium]